MASRNQDVGELSRHFESLTDPRDTRNRHHLLVDVLVIAVCAVTVGCDGPTAIARWARMNPTYSPAAMNFSPWCA